MEVRDFSEGALSCETDDQLFDLLLRFQGARGFDNAVISSFTRNGPIVHCLNAPKHWQEEYFDRQLWRHDTAFHIQESYWKPHLWSDLITDNLSVDEKEFWNASHDAGMCNGHTVSVAVNGTKYNIAVSSTADFDDHKRRKTVFETYSVASIFAAKLSLLRQSEFELKVSPRELELVKWIVASKSNVEIAQIMSISVRTVETMIRRICLKNDLSGRIEIAIAALLDPAIHIF